MRKFYWVMLLLVANNYKSWAQPFEEDNTQPTFVHLITGFANYSGDLKLEQYSFDQSKPLLGIGVQHYLSNKFSVRGEIIATTLSADDKLSGEKYRLKRNLNFTTHITEGSLIMQYDWFGLDNERHLTPYFFTGVGFFHYNPYALENGNKVSMVSKNVEGTTFQLNQFNIPMGAGLKWNMSNNFQVSAELNSKVLFTDYLDGISIRGNTRNKDNYYYMAVHLAINLSALASNQISYYNN